jgi:hypothetical protein
LNFKSSNTAHTALPGVAKHAPDRTQRYPFIADAKLVAKKLVRGGRIAWQRAILAGLQFTLTPGRSKRRNAFMAAGSGRRAITLFLAPEAGLEPFYASHVILARVLSDAGHSALILSCDGLQPTCSLKIAMRLPPTKAGETGNAACVRCRASALRVGARYGLPDITLEELLDQARRAEIESVMKANDDAPWKAVYDGMAVGAGCLGETLRAQRKVSVDELNNDDIALVRALLFSSLAVYLAVKELGARFDIQRIVYFGDYAYFLPPQIYAVRHRIPLTNVCHAYHRDTDRRFLNLWPTHAAIHQLEQVRRWEKYQTDAIEPTTVAEITNGALYRLYGHGGVSTYSPNWSESPGDLLEQLGLASGGRVLVAYTNSTDELVCNQHTLQMLDYDYLNARNPFPTQLAWLQQLVDWVSERPDLRLILRLHPRMAVSTRHANLASEYGQMTEAFASLPPNVAVVWPESPVSSYNLAELADVVLTAWSSIGLELARFGVPVIAAFQGVGPFPNGSFIGFAESAAGYFAAIERALDSAPTLDSIVGAFRWTHFLHWTPLIDVADVIPSPDYDDVPNFHTPRNADTILKVMAEGEDLIALNMARLKHAAVTTDDERRAIMSAIETIIFYFMTGRLNRPAGLKVRRDSAGTAPSIETERDNVVTMIDGDHTIHRHSPIVARLVAILQASQRPVLS